MKIILLVLIAYVISFKQVTAQFSIGLGTGITISNSIQNEYDKLSTHLKPGLGYYFELPIQISITKVISFTSGIALTQKNYSFHRTDSLAGSYISFRNSYIQVPFALQVILRQQRKIQLCTEIGGFISYWAAGKLKGQIPNILNSHSSITSDGEIIENLEWSNFNEHYKFSEIRDNRFELGVLLGGGVKVPVNKYVLFFNGVWATSLTGQRKEYSINGDRKVNEMFVIRMGIMVPL